MENFRAGDKVIYTGCNDSRKLLIEGVTYYVEKVEVHSSYTKLSLRGVYGHFNRLSFKKI